MVLHQCPFDPFGTGNALFCVFDGHSGSQAAQKAKAIVPGLLSDKLKVKKKWIRGEVIHW